MPDVEIVQVESASQLNEFINYPTRLYRNNRNYVIPLVSERKEFFDFENNPFYKTAKVQLYLAKRGKETVGRIAACINFAHNEVHGEKAGFFGFFDCIDNFEVASLLLKVVMIYLKKEGMLLMRGPMNFSTNHEIGFLMEGYDSPPFVMMTWNPPYLLQLAERFGLKKEMDLNAYIFTKETPFPERVTRVMEKLKTRSPIKIRTINMSDFDNEVRRINKIYNAAWERNWGFVPMDEEEFFYMAKNLKQIVEPELTLIAELDGNPVAFSLSLPDINDALIHLNGKLFPFGLIKLLWLTKVKKVIKGIRVITMGVIPEYQRRGIESMMFYHTYTTGVKLGYTRAELSWTLENNEPMNRMAIDIGASLYKKYRIVSMPLHSRDAKFGADGSPLPANPNA